MTNQKTIEKIVVRLAGDSGDGIQFAGGELAAIQAIFGHAVQTLPDYPAEIRAPIGTLPGVSGFQVQFAAEPIYTSGDSADVLIALNPAALKMHLSSLNLAGLLIVNEDSFIERDLTKANYAANPLTDGSLQAYQVIAVPMTELVLKTLAELSLPRSKVLQCRNIFALGILLFLYDADLDMASKRLAKKFAKQSVQVEANQLALKAGYAYAQASELFQTQYQVPKAHLPLGKYRYLSGNEAFAYAIASLAYLGGREVLVAGYPITPASTVLHHAAKFHAHGVKTFQAEDEIAAMGAVLGAAYGGHLAITITSGPGLDLKTEAIGLCVMTELPAIIIDVQRAGPATGMPTKVEQADLLQAVYGRHGHSPLPVVAPATPADCFDLLICVAQIALDLMTPVIILSDANLATGMIPWKIPAIESLPKLKFVFAKSDADNSFKPYERNAMGARPWALPGTPELMHCIGGLEKSEGAGKVSYDPKNHEKMVMHRRKRLEDYFEKNEMNSPQFGKVSGRCEVP
jgi:2-oxoglutarate/2-oxoacid ferredoxin oxidoreductase subunit alpha